jgi:hypothetical protein
MAYQLLNTRWGGTTLTCMKKATSRNKWLIFPQHHTGHRKLHEIVLRAFWKIGGKKTDAKLGNQENERKIIWITIYQTLPSELFKGTHHVNQISMLCTLRHRHKNIKQRGRASRRSLLSFLFSKRIVWNNPTAAKIRATWRNWGDIVAAHLTLRWHRKAKHREHRLLTMPAILAPRWRTADNSKGQRNIRSPIGVPKSNSTVLSKM